MNATAPKITRNRAEAAQVAAHLAACDATFIPPLSARVDLAAYADRIVRHAERFEAWSGPQLTGLVAAYCNDSNGRRAFITSVSVLPDWQGRGIASRLLRECVQFIRAAGFESVELEVHEANDAALGLYRRHGFADAAAGSAGTRMLELQIQQGGFA